MHALSVKTLAQQMQFIFPLRRLSRKSRRERYEIKRVLARFRTEESMKRVLSILLLSVLIFGAFTFAPTSNTFAQTTVRTRYHRHRRTFWQKHRDKLTVAGTTLGGAAIGGLAAGKKGAAIGSLAGAGSGALYTYKIRKRHRHYRRY